MAELTTAERKVCEALKLNPEYWDISGDNPAARLAVRLQEQLDARSQWVSVETALPKELQDVLVWPQTKVASWIEGFSDHGKVYESGFYEDHGVEPIGEVTHWQPLPDPPSGPQPGDKA